MAESHIYTSPTATPWGNIYTSPTATPWGKNNKMETPYLPPPAPSKGGEYANLSSKRIHTQPSTLFPYFSLNKEIREGEIVAVATKGAVRNKGFRIRCVNNKNI